VGSPTTPILDTFDRANEDPLSGGGNWQDRNNNNQLLIASNQCRGKTAGVLSTNYWAANSFGPNQEVYVSVPVIPSTAADYLRFYARLTNPGAASETGYVMQWSNDANGCRIFAETARETFTTIATNAAARTVAGDLLFFELAGSNITVYQNGVSVLTVSDSLFTTGGNLGLGGRGIVYRFDDFGGGSTAASDVLSMQTHVGRHVF
jgi:hypothetical protein